MDKIIYLDNNASTPMDPRVLAEMMPYLADKYGNAASRHKLGKYLDTAVEKSRRQIADLIDTNVEEIFFTAGATEAINMGLRGLLRPGKHHIITVATEHPAVLETCMYLETRGNAVTYLSVDSDGLIDFEELERAFTPYTALVCVMHVNHDTGVIQDIERIAEIAHAHGAFFMTDGSQSVGKLPVHARSFIDILTFSAHKFYGPKGMGGIYFSSKVPMKPLIFPGGHEGEARSGTLNVPGIVGMGKAAELAASQMNEDEERIGKLRDILEQQLLAIGGAKLIGSKTHRIYTTSTIRFDGIDSEYIVQKLDNICVCNCSVLSNFETAPSPVLQAMGLRKDEAFNALRFSLGRFTTVEEIGQTVEAVGNTIKQLHNNKSLHRN
ncbi:cysteine desulfurase family protein [Sphingobacterium puteale]|uniref:cysteine desulfurase family protein n=1 Tax=Sphingobacterium puteale TaxID=2420510 RepID=UPI003D98FEBE